MASTLTNSDHQLNYLSISSGIAGLWEGGPDAQPCPLPVDGQIIQPTNICDASLKICDSTQGLTLTGIQVYQGLMDSLNCQNQAHDLVLQGDFALGDSPGLQALTIKGGCYNIKISGVIHQAGTYSDCTINEWSDQCLTPAHDIDLTGLTMSNGQSVRIVAANLTNVKLPLGAKILLFKSLELKVYVWIKGLVRKILHIPVGVSGPSWLS